MAIGITVALERARTATLLGIGLRYDGAGRLLQEEETRARQGLFLSFHSDRGNLLQVYRPPHQLVCRDDARLFEQSRVFIMAADCLGELFELARSRR